MLRETITILAIFYLNKVLKIKKLVYMPYIKFHAIYYIVTFRFKFS